MNIASPHLAALEDLGYTESEARFLYLAATYSGYFTARQFLAYTRAHWGKRTTNFWSKIERLRHARTERFPKSGAIHHLFSRRLYHTIEKERLRNRRVHELDFIKRRIAMLDFVITNQEYEYLETEAQKVSYFCDKLGINERFLPARLYLGQKTTRSSVRYFVDGCPMFLGSAPPVVTFTYVHEGPARFAEFIHHLENYLSLFRQLSEFRMLYVSRTDAHFARAREIFDSLVKIPLESDIAEDLLRYFRVRKMWEEKQYTLVTDVELIFRNEARSRFQGATFEGLYRNWKNGQVSAASIEERFRRNELRRTIGFGTYQLSPIEILRRDPADLGAEGKTCALQARDRGVLHQGKFGSSSEPGKYKTRRKRKSPWEKCKIGRERLPFFGFRRPKSFGESLPPFGTTRRAHFSTVTRISDETQITSGETQCQSLKKHQK